MIDDNTTTVEERYITANLSSSLRCETRQDAPIGAIGVVIACGWSASRIGAALMRLHTRPDRNGLEQMHGFISQQAAYWGIERPEAVAASVLSWWLSHVCGKCSGVRFELVPGTPMLSNRHCKACKGTGESVLPHGSDGRRLVGFLDDCKSRATDSIKRRLKATR